MLWCKVDIIIGDIAVLEASCHLTKRHITGPVHQGSMNVTPLIGRPE